MAAKRDRYSYNVIGDNDRKPASDAFKDLLMFFALQVSFERFGTELRLHLMQTFIAIAYAICLLERLKRWIEPGSKLSKMFNAILFLAAIAAFAVTAFESFKAL